ncbi:AAA family ATPase [Deinococcus aquiradiocola]|uniref:ATPase n=1 Tax=Deinococcus aquiradiocola TaxID=393059 RepID=A0A917UN64_9DEIO|nr:MoxR family ATPase [Deinococcus aquiradiocola]GGJ69719.1 ATPase [Deinococcus aquiradiocola]
MTLSPDVLTARFAEHGHVVSEEYATALSLSLTLQRPLLVEGPAGVGKTQSARTLAQVLGTRLIRLQCYEGLDAQSALYEWNYPRQLLHLRVHDAGPDRPAVTDVYSESFLLRRPLLEAITQDTAPVLLIDEVDRADEAFEAFLLELLSEWQISIPELGTIRAAHPPHVILTGNRTRDLSDALRRRCLYAWQAYPSADEERRILHARQPDLPERLAVQVVAVMAALRALPLRKTPGVAETLDWALALTSLGRDSLDEHTLRLTRGCILKAREDWATLDANIPALQAAWGGTPAASARPDTDFGIGSVRVR